MPPRSRPFDIRAARRGAHVDPHDGVALFEHLLKRTEPLVAIASAELKDSVWLYQAQAKATGTLTKLDGSVLGYNVAGFVSRHGLLGDNWPAARSECLPPAQDDGEQAVAFEQWRPVHGGGHHWATTPRSLTRATCRSPTR